MRKKAEKIKDNIVLSIKYARLKEESSDTEKKKLDLVEKKNFFSTNEKKIDQSNKLIESLNKAISKIEQNNTPGAYSLVVNNEMKEHLNKLSGHKDFELIKYGIALEIILDDDFKYTDNTNIDFIERISLILFDDKSVIKKIEDDYKKIESRIYGTHFKNYLESAATFISKLPIKDLVKKAVYIPKKALAVAGATAFGIGRTYLKLRKQSKKLSTLSSGEFANRLIISAMNLLFAAKYFSETEYKNYFKYKLKEINLDRKFIMKELFEEHYEIEDNQLKIELLHNFDDYLIEQMNLYNNQRSK